ncbi:hypothetical protein BDN71DRAFT_1447962, partial [Pleurotus eryngii]
MTIAAMYRFLITDFLNPFALASGGAGSGEVYVRFLIHHIPEMLTFFGFTYVWFFGVPYPADTRF